MRELLLKTCLHRLQLIAATPNPRACLRPYWHSRCPQAAFASWPFAVGSAAPAVATGSQVGCAQTRALTTAMMATRMETTTTATTAATTTTTRNECLMIRAQWGTHPPQQHADACWGHGRNEACAGSAGRQQATSPGLLGADPLPAGQQHYSRARTGDEAPSRRRSGPAALTLPRPLRVYKSSTAPRPVDRNAMRPVCRLLIIRGAPWMRESISQASHSPIPTESGIPFPFL